MGRKGYNWKSRQVVNTIIDDSTTKKIHLDLAVQGNYDKSNELVLPSTKRKTKVKDDKSKITRILSKKHRKRLEKIVDKKKKKENRSSLLDALSKVQATSEELEKLTSISTIQTKGLKRFLQEESSGAADKKRIKRDDLIVSGEIKLNSLSGAKRRELLTSTSTVSTDPNVVGFGDDSDSGHDSESETESPPLAEPVKPEPPKQKPIAISKPAVFVDVIRSPQIQESRLKLPILAEEQQIMETISENPVTIIAGETGSGKTTQVPQFLFEGGYALDQKQIAVTEPRRVAAIAMSRRVAEEMNLTAREVSYLIRFEGNVTEDTKIKFMTDGVLLREIQTDFLLNKYSVVILDEAHERSVYTDILIGLLSRIVPMRLKRGVPLKLIVMSATLRVEDFTSNQRLFKVAPAVITVDSRQFPVTIHFNKRTNVNYLTETYNKAVKIHTKLPEGGILIFLTGQQEVKSLVKKLRRKFPLGKLSALTTTDRDLSKNNQSDDSDSDFFSNTKQPRVKKNTQKISLPEVNLDDFSIPGDFCDEIGNTDNSDSGDEVEVGSPVQYNNTPLWVLPLYSMLPTDKQSRVFQKPPDGCRLCVVATNVAETSLTIPNVKYVIDCGKSKQKLFDRVTGVTSYVIDWISKASADQRAGRAGRTGPGHCYRLYSSAVFNDQFPQFAVPEIQQKPVDDLYLQMKCMNIDKVVNFPFPTAPDLLQLKTAERRLEVLGALHKNHVTPLGRAIVKFPVLPRFGKMLALSHQQDLLAYTICLVSALSVQEILLEKPLVGAQVDVSKKWAGLRRKWAGLGNSLLLGDNMVLLKAVGAAEFANSRGKLAKFCFSNGLREKAVVEIRKLRVQLTNEILINLPEAGLCVDPNLAPPTDLQAKLLRQILLSGLGDQVARKIECQGNEDLKKYRFGYNANNMEEPVYLHSSSVLRKTPPEFVIYQEIYETNKIYMRGVTAIEPEWLPVYVPDLCNLSSPLSDPEPVFKNGRVYCTVSGSFGSQGWTLPNVEVEYPRTVDCYRWFARFLLEGVVFERLGRFKGSLLSQPVVMVKSWAKLQPRTDAVLKELMRRQVCTKSGLEELWREVPKYLFEEYLKWLPESAHGELTLLWPPLD